MNIRTNLSVLLGTFALVGCTAAGAVTDDDLAVSFTAHGTVDATESWHHEADANHSCAIVERGWKNVGSGGQMVEVPPAPPLLEVLFNATAPETEPRFRVAISDFKVGLGARWATPDDHVEINLGGVHWYAGGPNVKFEFSPNGRAGSVHAEGLAPVLNPQRDKRRIDLDAKWSCPQLDNRTD